MKFTCKGHKNILGRHKSTLEFTKHKEVSLQGDCIIGIDATFDSEKVTKDQIVKFTLKTKHNSDEFICITNPEFSDTDELVIRKTDFISKRTYGIFASKAAIDIDRNLIEELKDEKTQMNIEISAFKTNPELDQHFLINQTKIKKIIEHLNIQKDDIVLELGAGIGTVTNLIPDCKQILSIEIDQELSKYIKQKKNHEIITDDFKKYINTCKCTKLISFLPETLNVDLITYLKNIEFKMAAISSQKKIETKGLKVARSIPLDSEDFYPKQIKATMYYIER